jgi:hypothetical protein
LSIQKTKQIGGDEPLPPAVLELQQLVLGMFLIWDVLVQYYESKEWVERKVLADWARKHKVPHQTAVEALVMVKNRYAQEPWAHYIHCRDFKEEGWANVLVFTPNGNRDVLEQMRPIMESRPFKEPAL